MKNDLFIPATPYARLLAGERGVDLRLAKQTGLFGAVCARDVLDCAGALPARSAATPLARRMAADAGVDLAGVAGSGFRGKIRKADVFAAAHAAVHAENRGAKAGDATPAGGRRVKLSGMRRVVARRMEQAHAEIPPVTHTVRNDVTALVAAREKLNAGGGAKYSLNDFILMAVAKALVLHPNILASLEGEELVLKDRVNIGMAVAVEAGLVVPVIPDADRLSLAGLSAAARDLAARARENRLSPDEYKGNTFTVSNLGMYDVEAFTPIVNQPDAAILGVCSIVDELALANGAVTPRKIMRTCLTYDHRLVDGATAAKFQKEIKRFLENPIELFL